MTATPTSGRATAGRVTAERAAADRGTGSLLGRAIEGVLGEADPARRSVALVRLQAELVRAPNALLLLGTASDRRGTVHYKEGREGAAPPAWSELAVELAAEARQAQGSVVRAREALPASDAAVLVAQPLYGASDGVDPVAIFELPDASPPLVALARERLELSARLARITEAPRASGLSDTALELVTGVGAAAGFDAGASALCTELARRLGATRVALGLEGWRGVELVAMANVSRFDRGGSAVHALEQALDASVRREVEAAHPPLPGVEPCAALAEMQAECGFGRAITVPIRVRGARAGALLVEHDAAEGLGDRELAFVRLVLDATAPGLLDRRRALRDRARDAVNSLRRDWEQPRGTARKLGWVAAAAALLYLLLPAPYRVEAPFEVKARERRIVTAPFDARLLSADLQPGDRVVAGETVLATLDTEELELEWSRARAESLQALKEADAAREAGEPADEQVALHAAERARASMALATARIEQAELRAPVGGVLLKGDLRRRLGAPLARGEALFEVAPIDALEAEVDVPEAQVLHVAPGQEGAIVSAARPGVRIPVRVLRVDPVAVVREGRNVFPVLVEVTPGPEVAGILPGMRGVARIEAGRASRLWIWTREAVHWLRLTFWI